MATCFDQHDKIKSIHRCFICAREIKLKTVFNPILESYAVLICIECAGNLTLLLNAYRNGWGKLFNARQETKLKQQREYNEKGVG